MPTKKRQSQRLAKLTAGRLEELRTDAQLTVVQFAQRCALPGKASPAHTTFVAWRSGRSIPGGQYLHRIATEFGVSVDWLLGLDGAPKYRNQNREEAALEADLAAAVERELNALVPPRVAGTRDRYEWRVSGRAAIKAAIDTLAEHAKQALARESDRSAVRNDIDGLHHALEDLTEGSRMSVKAAQAGLRVLKVERRLLARMASPVASPGAPVLLIPESLLGLEGNK